MFKKSISVVLIIVMILSLFTIIPVSVNAHTFPNVSDFPDFDMDCYVADLFTNPDTAQYDHIRSEMNSNTTNKIMRNGIESNSSMMAAMTAWQVATFQASDTSHDAVTELGYYESIILSSLKAAMKSTPVKDVFDNAVIKDGKMCFEIFKNAVKGDSVISNLDLSNYNNLSTAEQKAYLNCFEDAFKKQHPNIENTSKFLSAFGNIVKTGKAAEDCINLFSSYYHCSLVDDYLCEVINDLYEQCPDDNITMKAALFNISGACTSEEMDLGVDSLDVIYRGVDLAYGIVVDDIFNTIISSQPAGLTIMIGHAIGKAVSNLLFSTDAICENYYKICCFDEFEKLVRSVTQYEIDKYKNDRTNYNANVLFSSVGLMFEINEVSCDISIEYAETIYEKSVAGIFLDKNECDRFKKTVNSIRDSKQSVYYQLMTEHIFNLEEDYPEIYAAYMKQIDEIENPVVHTTGISFNKKHMTLGLTDDTWFFWNNAEVTPANATNRAVSYVSSDEDVVSIIPGNTLKIELHQTGTVTITAIAEDGGYTDELVIDVVDGHGDDGIHLEDPVTNIIDSGKCGDDVYWNLYNNGTLKIFGNGSMYDYYYNSYPWYDYSSQVNCVIISYGVSSIGNHSFDNCYNLLSVSLPNSVCSIGKYSFYNTDLTSIFIPDSIETIGEWAFCGSKLATITISDSVINIGLMAFDNTPWLSSQPDGLVYIGKVVYRYLYQNQNYPSKVVINEGTRGIAGDAFLMMDQLEEVTIPNSVQYIGESAFMYTNLNSIIIPDSVKYIGDLAFHGTRIESVCIPDSVISIGDSAFGYCYALKNVTLSNSVKAIGKGTFEYCYSLSYISIPNSVESIGEEAFSFAHLESVSIPDSVKTIGNGAFFPKTVNKVYYQGTQKQWEEIKVGNNNDALLNANIHFLVSGPIEPSGISLNQNDLALEIGDSIILSAIILPENATETDVTWKSSDTDVVSVSEGKVIAVGTGNAIITATSSNGIKAICSVTIKPKAIEVTGISLNKSTLTLEVGDSESLTATVLPNNATDKTVTWKSNNTNVASVAKGKVTAIEPGPATITAISSNGIATVCYVTVKPKTIEVTGIRLNKTNVSLEEGDSYSLTATVQPNNATDKSVSWRSNNTNIVTVTNGKVDAISPGTTTVIAIASNGITATCYVNVYPKEIEVTDVLLNYSNITLSVGETEFLDASVFPENATDKTIEWTSSNPEVATVYDGVITAFKPGTTSITATATNGKKASCEVIVNAKQQILLGDSFAVEITEPGERVEYLFIPDQDMIITFSGESEKGFWIYIDGSGSGNSSGFEMSKNCIVEAGQTYHLSVEMYEENETGTVDVSLRGGLINSISLGETVEAPLTGPYQSVFYRFVPDASMMIRFHSNEEGAKLSLNDEDAYSICSVTNSDLFCYVQEGEIYYLQVEQSEYSEKVKTHTVILNEFDPVEIQKDKEELITVEDSRSKDYYKYIAESDMEICFCAFSDDAIGISLYDSDMYWLDSKGSYSKSCKITYDVKKGETYYFAIDYSNHYDQDHTGSVKILVRETEPTDAWSYTHNDDGTISLTHYKGTDESVIVPLQIDGFSVSGLESCSFNKRVKHLTIPDGISNASITSGDLYSVSLGKSICEFSCASWSNSNLQRFNVDAQNQYYKSIDGILLDKKTDFILQYPRGKNSTKYSIPEGVKGIGESAFSNNSYLEEVVFASSILSVDQSAFSGCSKLKNVQMDQNLEQINKFAFQSCVELESITIPSGVTKIEDNPFDGCLSLNTIQVDNANQQYSSADGVLFNKDKTKLLAYPTNKENEKYIVPDTVKAINKSAYSGNEMIHEVVLPNGLSIIGSQSFFNCINLEKVNIPYGLETIESSAFSQTAIKELDIPDSVTNIGNGAFARCEQLSSIRIPNGINKIEAFTFQSCDSLTDVSIPSSVTQIERYAFSYSPMLTNIEIPESVIYIGEYAFQGTDWLKRQPNEPLYINRVLYQFRGDVPKTYTIKEGTICVTANAFNDCYSLENIKAPDSLRYIGYNAFSETKWYDDQPNDTLIYIGKIAYQYKCSSENGQAPNYPKTIRLKSDTLAIADCAFLDCYSVEQINLPDTLLHIGYEAFFNCIGLKKLFIPNNVVTIGDYALGYASGGYYGITIYGYPGTIAETYSKEKDFEFVPLTNHTLIDTDTNISVALVDEAILSISEITDTNEIIESLPPNNAVYATYDIALIKDGTIIQPLDKVTVSIPCKNKNAKVYRVEKDGTLTDMRAVYQNDYMVFTTTHFSVYVITVPNTITPFILGDVDGNREIEIVDSTWIQRDVALITIPFVINKESADVDKDGEVTVMDASFIQKHLAELKTSIQIGNELT